MASRHVERRAASHAGSRIRPRFAADDRLVALVRGGDPTAFEILYDRHSRELLSSCSYILGSRHDAEDAVQSTFASAYRALLADERDVDLRPWLFAIARNASLSILRKRQPTTEINGAEPGRDDPVAQAEQREDLRQVLSTMLELPEHQRTALVLAEIHGLSHGEIGAVLGVRTERVKSYVYQARSSLISERLARSADCLEIREELATARGPPPEEQASPPLRSCEGCRDYAQQLSRQRGQLGILLPVLPSLALKRRVLEAASSDATSAGTCRGGAAVGGSLAGITAELAGAGGKALVASAGRDSRRWRRDRRRHGGGGTGPVPLRARWCTRGSLHTWHRPPRAEARANRPRRHAREPAVQLRALASRDSSRPASSSAARSSRRSATPRSTAAAPSTARAGKRTGRARKPHRAKKPTAWREPRQERGAGERQSRQGAQERRAGNGSSRKTQKPTATAGKSMARAPKLTATARKTMAGAAKRTATVRTRPAGSPSARPWQQREPRQPDPAR